MILYRRGQLGDVVLLGSVTAALDRVTVATDPRWFPVAKRLRGVECVIPAQRWQAPWIDLQGSVRSLGRRRIHKHGLRRRLRLHLGLPSPRPSVPELYGHAVGVTPAPPPWIDLEVQQRDTLVLVPGASTPLKRPPLSLFEELARRWRGPIVVLGGPGEHFALPGESIAEAGFERTFETLSRAAVVVGGDTGLLHLAGATGAPTVMLFGPTHPDDGFHVYPGAPVQRELACRPCTLHRRTSCPLLHHRCMDLDPNRVWDAIEARCAG